MLLPLALLAALHAAPARALGADSVTGTWKITGDVVGNPVNELCTLKQSGAAVTGSCKNADAADAKPYDVTGEVKGDTVTFRHGGDYQGTAITLTYTGTTAAPRALRGTIDVQPFGVNGTFTAAPPPAPAKP